MEGNAPDQSMVDAGALALILTCVAQQLYCTADDLKALTTWTILAISSLCSGGQHTRQDESQGGQLGEAAAHAWSSPGPKGQEGFSFWLKSERGTARKETELIATL